MAKQNVGFGERHLEKIVVGVAGAVLAAMLFLFVVQDPYAIEISGQSVGPGAFYPQLDEQATQMLVRIKNAPPREVPDYRPPVTSAQRVNTDLGVVFAPPHPPVPPLLTGIEIGKLDLVGILPPGKPALTTGRAFAALSAAGQVGTVDLPVDNHWAAVFATVPRREQQQAFMDAKYAVSRQLLVVTEVEAERQRLLPSGEWGPAERVSGNLKPPVLPMRRTVELDRQDGAPVIADLDYRYIEDLKAESIKQQQEILRPGFQALLQGDAQMDWTVPAEMHGGVKFDWVQDYMVIIPATSAVTPDAAGGRVDYRKIKGEIDALIAAGNFIEAERKARDAVGLSGLLPNNRRELDQMLVQLGPRAQQQAINEEQARTARQQLESESLGADVDLLWLTDTSVTPGQMYRYRVRVWALNPHAGLIRNLKNPEDAAKVMLAGEWSEWSDPIAVKPSRYLFCTGLDGDLGVKVELNQWTGGEWDKTNQTMLLGQPAAFSDKLKEFAYDAVAALLEPAASYEERAIDRRGGVSYRPARQTQAILFVRSDGEVEEHLVLEDLARRRELAAEFAPKKDAAPRQAITPTGGRGFNPPGPTGPRGPAGGGGRFRDD